MLNGAGGGVPRSACFGSRFSRLPEILPRPRYFAGGGSDGGGVVEVSGAAVEDEGVAAGAGGGLGGAREKRKSPARGLGGYSAVKKRRSPIWVRTNRGVASAPWVLVNSW